MTNALPKPGDVIVMFDRKRRAVVLNTGIYTHADGMRERCYRIKYLDTKHCADVVATEVSHIYQRKQKTETL